MKKPTRVRIITFRPDEDIAAAMDLLRERDGMFVSEQVRRALRAWLESKDVLKPERKRAEKERRSR